MIGVAASDARAAVGVCDLKRREGTHEAIIDRETFDAEPRGLKMKTVPKELAVGLIEQIEIGKKDPESGQQEVKVIWKF